MYKKLDSEVDNVLNKINLEEKKLQIEVTTANLQHFEN